MMKRLALAAAALMTAAFACSTFTTSDPASPIYGFELDSIDGDPVALSAFEDDVLLIVNTASKCGLTPQYDGLEKLYKEYRDKGFAVLGFPSNEFGAQEPGQNHEIKEFCKRNFGVTFPLFSKIVVTGNGIHPLYAYLTEQTKTEEGATVKIRWNFEKFLVNRNGEVVARFVPNTEPYDPELVATLESALAEPRREGSDADSDADSDAEPKPKGTP